MKKEDKAIQLAVDAYFIATSNRQVVGEKNDMYITLEQLNELLMKNKI